MSDQRILNALVGGSRMVSQIAAPYALGDARSISLIQDQRIPSPRTTAEPPSQSRKRLADSGHDLANAGNFG